MRHLNPKVATLIVAVTFLTATIDAPSARGSLGPPSSPSRGGQPGQSGVPTDGGSREFADAPSPEADSSSLLVRFRPGISVSARRTIALEHGAKIERAVERTSFFLASVDGRPINDVRRSLAADGRVAAVKPNYLYRVAAVPDDPRYSDQAPYLELIHLPDAWELSRGAEDLTLAVVDSGVDFDHPDLVGRLLPGRNFATLGPAPNDDMGHGTRIATIAAANADDGSGMAGIAWRGKILPVKVLGGDGSGRSADIAAGITWAAAQGADVINLSFGANRGADEVLQEAIEFAQSRDAVIVAAVGNDGQRMPLVPASVDGVIGVASVDAAGNFAPFSNYGSWVDLAAPGVDIVSGSLNGTYPLMTGTSASTAFVSGIALLARARFPQESAEQIGQRLRSSARDAGAPGFDEFYGHGVVDALDALDAPDAPGGPRPTPLDPYDSHEPNNQPLHASPVTSEATATLAPGGDVDWFVTTVAGSPRWLSFTVTPPADTTAEKMDAEIALFDSGLQSLGRSDEGGNGAPETLETYAVEGSYYLRVVNKIASPRPGPYQVAVTTRAGPPPGVTPAPPPDTPPAPPPGSLPASPPTTPDPPSGYWMISTRGEVFSFGSAAHYGNQPTSAVDIEPTPAMDGYWILSTAGRVSAKGAAVHFGDATLNRAEHAVSLSATATGRGYWVFTDRGRVIALGDAAHYGDLWNIQLNGPVLDSVATPSGQGYWMVASDGGIFSFGDATFHGSMGGKPLNEPVISMAPDPDGTGYWLVAWDGGIFAFDAPFYGSMGNVPLNQPVSGMVHAPAGYLMVAEDGGIFAFGDVTFHGSLGSTPPADAVVAAALTRSNV